MNNHSNTKENRIALIPARYNASRFPGKLVQKLGTYSVIQRTFLAVQDSGLFHEVWVICDDDRIDKEIKKIDGNCLCIKKKFHSGTDRIADVVTRFSENIIVNVQGDEPFISKKDLEKLIGLFDIPDLDIATLCKPFKNIQDIENADYVKLIKDENQRVLDFSRKPFDHANYHHIGIYGFKKKALLKFVETPPTPREIEEKLENLRMIDLGMKIYAAETDSNAIAIDRIEDLQKAENILNTKKKKR